MDGCVVSGQCGIGEAFCFTLRMVTLTFRGLWPTLAGQIMLCRLRANQLPVEETARAIQQLIDENDPFRQRWCSPEVDPGH